MECKLTDYQILIVSLLPGIGRKTLHSIIQKIQFHPENTDDIHDALDELAIELPRFKAPNIDAIRRAEKHAKKRKEEIDDLLTWLISGALALLLLGLCFWWITLLFEKT